MSYGLALFSGHQVEFFLNRENAHGARMYVISFN
jgi:hypothetical protein